MKTIVCHLNLFDACQKVQLYNESGQFEANIGLSSLDKLDSLLIALSSHYNIKHIHIFGNPEYVNVTKRKAIECAKNIYEINDIEIEVN